MHWVRGVRGSSIAEIPGIGKIRIQAIRKKRDGVTTGNGESKIGITGLAVDTGGQEGQ